jgi:hypothetical protein
MEQQSDKHSPRVDDALEREVESLTRGAPVESRADPHREIEAAGNGEPAPEGILRAVEEPHGAGSLSHADVRRRSDLAMHLRPSIFPATRAAILECAREEGAPDDVLDVLETLDSVRSFRTTEEIWEALGGEREAREHPEISGTAAETPASLVFPLRFDRLHRLLALPFGVTPGNARVEIDRDRGTLVARFGPWRVETPLTNISEVHVTGGYSPLKTVGPAHLSLADRGLTFATNDAEGVCIAFHEPVHGIDPRGIVKHPALTVTVEDAQRLVAALRP